MPEIKVPQKDGVIRIDLQGNGPITWSVSGHVANVGDDNVELFLAHVPGSSLVSKTETSKKGK